MGEFGPILFVAAVDGGVFVQSHNAAGDREPGGAARSDTRPRETRGGTHGSPFPVEEREGDTIPPQVGAVLPLRPILCVPVESVGP